MDEVQDHGNGKEGSGSSDFRLLHTMEPLSINDWHNPPNWVSEELQKRGLSNAGDRHGSQTHSALLDLIKTCGKAKDLRLACRIHRDVAN
ncbi:hypothetical protein GOP47_0025962 [Adiantum capillus-veneris]|uniref:Uncharacterized protein n=1 Tax=Adiantum capillus-veneris TaxID=13818 RepID=A0A9D4U262_ADICA|nr:hypothetical protein GOP47_0025962 [Adiantum capillus-veneris]